MENKNKEFKLKHFALFAKGWYNKTGDEMLIENVWKNVRSVLWEGDNFAPLNNDDVISILVQNVTHFVKKNITDFTAELVKSVHPDECWKCGYGTEDNWGHGKYPYDYQTAVLFFFIDQVKYMREHIIGKLPVPDARVMPFKELSDRELIIFT